jgi:glycosyltransferase involved in cell wall biosynthesis
MFNLSSITEPISCLQKETGVPVRIIGVGSATLPGVDLEVRQWSAETEVANLQDCNIGLVPLNDTQWNPWKFFLKTVQYMAVGIPVVARRMGSNAEVIQDGVNGFLVDSKKEWHDRLRLLIENAELRRQMGIEARKTIIENYSIQSQMPRVVDVFERVITSHHKPEE